MRIRQLTMSQSDGFQVALPDRDLTRLCMFGTNLSGRTFSIIIYGSVDFTPYFTAIFIYGANPESLLLCGIWMVLRCDVRS